MAHRSIVWLCLGGALISAPVGGCRSTPSGGAPPAALAPERVAPEYRREWEAVQEARSADPTGASVVAAADRLLARDPPINLRLAAIHAKVSHAYLLGDDAVVQRWSDQAAAAVDLAGGAAAVLDDGERRLLLDLRRLAAVAAARGGDPAEGLARLDAAERAGAIGAVEIWGARAAAYERKGERGEALVAYAEWRARLDAGSAEARYAEAKMGELVRTLPRSERGALRDRQRGPVAECLDASVGGARGDAPAWTAACRGAGRRVGVLLPRSGPFAELANTHLAAAVAAVRVLAASGSAEVEVVWAESGATVDEARTAALALREAGVDAVVGPIGAANVGASAQVFRGAVAQVLLGESVDGVGGVAPSLEARCAALIAVARRLRVPGVVVVAPANAYGSRAARAIERAAAAEGLKVLHRSDFPLETTSFAPVLAPALGDLRRGAALIVAHHVAGTALILKQAAREGLSATGAGARLVVLATGESLRPAAVEPVLEGTWLAPSAWESAESAEFAAAYAEQEGEPPGDQALLVWRALAASWRGEAPRPPSPALVKVQGGRLVVVEEEVVVQPRG